MTQLTISLRFKTEYIKRLAGIVLLSGIVSFTWGQGKTVESAIGYWLQLSGLKLEENNYDSALFYISKARELETPGTDIRLKAEISGIFGKAYYGLTDFDAAEENFREVIRLGSLAKDTLLVATGYNDLGKLYKRNAHYSDALNCFNLARQYYHAAGDSSGIALVSLNVGNVLKSVGHNQLAITEYRKALGYFIQTGDENNLASCYNNLGNIFKNEKMYDSAFYYMYRTLEIRKRGNSRQSLAFIYHNLANLHLNLHQTDSALYYIGKSFEINQSIPSPADLAFDYNVYGSIYIELKDWSRAIQNLETARSLTQKSGISENLIDIEKQLGLVYYQTGNRQKSADHFMEFFRLSDSLNLINKTSYIEMELTRYTLFADSVRTKQMRLEHDLELVKQENAALANRINFRNYIYAIIILVLIVTLIAILFINARRRLAQTVAHEEILQIQNEELKRTLISKEEKEILLKEVHHRVKNNLQIINSLIRLQSTFMNARNFREKLMETENRIRSMALIHEKLYKTGNLASLSVRHYIEELSINILESYENHKVKIKLKFDLEEREYGIDTLIPLGLIINETLSNAMKHAFYERTEGHIFISIHSKDDFSYMTIKDDGIGADLTFDELKEDSLGMELIDSLCEQLDGKLSLNTDNGFEYHFKFRQLK